jgi:hypothetical protein
MKRNWNWALWIGFLFVLAGLFTYPFFVQYPVTRDFPWANLVLFSCGALLLVLGLMRAYRAPERHRGKIFGPVLALLSLLVFTFFAYALFYVVRQLPAAAAAPHVGQKAPDFTLPDTNGKPVGLAVILSSPLKNSGAKPRGAVLIFYRGHW